MRNSTARHLLSILLILGALVFFREEKSNLPFKELRELEAKIKWKSQPTETQMTTDYNLKTSFENDLSEKAISSANQFILNNPKLFSIQKHHQLAVKTSSNPLGTHVSYQVYQDGFAILGMNIDLIVNRVGLVRLVSNQYRPIDRVKVDQANWLTVPEIFQDQTIKFKLSSERSEEEKDNVAIWISPNSSQPELVYVVSVVDTQQKQKVPGQALFSVTTGQLIARHFPRSEFNEKPL